MTLIVSSERDADLEFEQANLMAARQVSGLLIVTSSKHGDDRLRRLQSTGLAVVAFDRPLPGAHTDCVIVENRDGAEQAMAHLIQHGHRRIACVGYDEGTYTICERVQGYTSTMLSCGLKPDTVFGLLTHDDVRLWLDGVLSGTDRPTAIFSLNHRTSVLLLDALAERQIKIPDQIAVVGFDDFDTVCLTNPPLTTVAQPPTEIARRSMALLLAGIRSVETGATTSPAKIMLPTRLIVRQSSGPHNPG